MSSTPHETGMMIRSCKLVQSDGNVVGLDKGCSFAETAQSKIREELSEQIESYRRISSGAPSVRFA